MEATSENDKQWFVMRDLKRPNALMPAYRQLGEAGFKVFTPMTTKVVERRGRKTRIQTPFVPDLLFVYSDREPLDSVVRRTETLQYRFVKGAAYGTPMIVPVKDMERFITAVTSVETPRYYQSDEITPDMYGARVRMICTGSMNGVEGVLLKVRGARKKRMLIELPGLLAAAVEVNSADYIELIQT